MKKKKIKKPKLRKPIAKPGHVHKSKKDYKRVKKTPVWILPEIDDDEDWFRW